MYPAVPTEAISTLVQLVCTFFTLITAGWLALRP